MSLKVTLIRACDLKIVLINNVAIHTKHDHIMHSIHKLIYFYIITYHTQYRNHSGFLWMMSGNHNLGFDRDKDYSALEWEHCFS